MSVFKNVMNNILESGNSHSLSIDIYFFFSRIIVIKTFFKECYFCGEVKSVEE